MRAVPGGPIAVFDKSALQSLSVDESVLFDNFYLPVVTPLFFVETLADLEKSVRKGTSAEEVVGIIAAKTPVMSGLPNVHHLRLVQNELLGDIIIMDRRPVVGEARRVVTGDQRGVVVEQLAEMEAFQRWQEGSFLDVERLYARAWRAELGKWDPSRGARFRAVIGRDVRVRDLPQAKALADRFVRGETGGRVAVLKVVFEIFDVPVSAQQEIVRRWKLAGGAPLADFAPYTAHVVNVEFFLQLAVQSSLISSERASNRVDMAYLYYLPFCMIFVSDDGLHMRTVPLFLGSDQAFIPGDELKADLARLNEHYSRLPTETLEMGIYSFASYPPLDNSFLTTRLWDRFMSSRWREHVSRGPRRSAKADAELGARLRQFDAARPAEPGEQFNTDSAQFVTIGRQVPIRRGKWRLISPEAEAAHNKSS
jgi:hypothetical protein